MAGYPSRHSTSTEVLTGVEIWTPTRECLFRVVTRVTTDSYPNDTTRSNSVDISANKIVVSGHTCWPLKSVNVTSDSEKRGGQEGERKMSLV